MTLSRTLIAAAFGLVLPLVAAGSADATVRHRHPARVTTATYKMQPQKALRHRTAATSHRGRVVAQAHHRSLTRGS